MARSERLERAVEESRKATHPNKPLSPLLYLGAVALVAAAGLSYLTATNTPIQEAPRKITEAITQPFTRKQYAPSQNNNNRTTVTTPKATQTPMPQYTPPYSELELKAISGEVFTITGPLTAKDTATLEKLAKINETYYFMLTGRNFKDDRFETRILPDNEYEASVHPLRKDSDGTTGYGANGTTFIFSRFENKTPDRIWTILAMETGSALANRIGVAKYLGVTQEKYDRVVEGLEEAYRTAVFHRMIELGQGHIIPSEGLESNRLSKIIDDFLADNSFVTEGKVFLWYEMLNDPTTREQLLEKGTIDSNAAIRTFMRIATDPNVYSRVQRAIADKKTLVQPIKDAMMKREILEGYLIP